MILDVAYNFIFSIATVLDLHMANLQPVHY